MTEIDQRSSDAKTQPYLLVKLEPVGRRLRRPDGFWLTYSEMDGSKTYPAIFVKARVMTWTKTLTNEHNVFFPDAYYSDSGKWARGERVLVMSPKNEHGLPVS